MHTNYLKQECFHFSNVTSAYVSARQDQSFAPRTHIDREFLRSVSCFMYVPLSLLE